MQPFYYRDNELWAENVPLSTILHEAGTPCFVYSHLALATAQQEYATALQGHPHELCYAVKANSNLAILKELAQLNCGFDIVSGGELARIKAAIGQAKSIHFSGVGKTAEEIEQALKHPISCFNVESEEELLLIEKIAAHLNVQAPVALRVNPDIDPKSHPYISTGLKENKFGIDLNHAMESVLQIQHAPHLKLIGIACHIGSQLTELTPFVETLRKLIPFVLELQKQNKEFEHLNMGGGLGVRYHQESVPSITEYVQTLLAHVPKQLKLIVEPGRSLVAHAGMLLTQVLYLKKTHHKHFCIVDAGMNDFIRPALYSAWHSIIPTQQNLHRATQTYDVVGPICESADFFGKERSLSVAPGDMLAIGSTGAYGFVLSSNYPSRPRAPEVLVKGSEFKIVRTRESLEKLYELERVW